MIRKILPYTIVAAFIFFGTSLAGAEENAQQANLIQIPLEPMADFNYKTKQEMYDIRIKAIGEHPELIEGHYSISERLSGLMHGKYSLSTRLTNITGNGYIPSDAIFGQIEDGKPWWGILGRSYYGNGQNSILGTAEESRFILNPYLLVGLDSGYGAVVNDPSIDPIAVYPVPLDLVWSADRKKALAKYDITAFWQGEQRIHYPSTHKVTLVGYNARDLGWNYLYVSPQSQNISAADHAVQIQQFIHTGGSCGYPGGCNNMSPHQPELEIKVNSLPAVAYIKLWKNAPGDVSGPADMIFIIQMI